MRARLCPYCKAMSNFQQADSQSAQYTPPVNQNQRLALDKCHNCLAIVYYRTTQDGEGVIDQYPKNFERAPDELPDMVKKAFDEALLCLASGAPNGSLLMCRRALQETLNDMGVKRGDLPVQLNDLVERRKITPQLKDWADQARIGGRIAAHGSGGNEWGDPDKIWGNVEDASIVIDDLTGC